MTVYRYTVAEKVFAGIPTPGNYDILPVSKTNDLNSLSATICAWVDTVDMDVTIEKFRNIYCDELYIYFNTKEDLAVFKLAFGV